MSHDTATARLAPPDPDAPHEAFVLTADERVLIADALRGLIVRYRCAADRFAKQHATTLAHQHAAIQHRCADLLRRVEGGR